MSLASFPILATAAAALSAACHLRAEYRGPQWQVYLFKPLTTALLLLVAAIALTAHGARYQRAVILGLTCSVLGDVALMLPRVRFVMGLTSFLLAHVAYIVAFTSSVSIGSAPVLLIPLLGATVPLLRLLWPGLGTLRLPVVLYAATLLLMVWLAWGWRWATPTSGSLFAAIGASLFMVSDAVLAMNRFHRAFPSAQAFIMATYVAAQALLALSVSTA
jgi:uncharacterized membrane protein YhhN